MTKIEELMLKYKTSEDEVFYNEEELSNVAECLSEAKKNRDIFGLELANELTKLHKKEPNSFITHAKEIMKPLSAFEESEIRRKAEMKKYPPLPIDKMGFLKKESKIIKATKKKPAIKGKKITNVK